MPQTKTSQVVGSVVLLAAIAGVAVLSSTVSSPRAAKAGAVEPATVTRVDLLRFFSAAGIDPESLTAAGLSPLQASTVVAQGRTYLEEHLTDLKQAFKDAADAAALAAKLPTDGQQTAAQLIAAADAAKSTRNTALAAFVTAALSGMPEPTGPTIARIRSNRSQGLPIEYLVKDRSSEEWASLRNALAAVRTAQARGETSPQTAQSLVTSVNEETEIAAAAAALATNAQAAKTAWTTALNN